MSSDPEPNEVDRGVDASMRMFEKSKVGDSPALVPIKPSRVLLVLDGSPQDETGIDAVLFLRETFNVEALILDGREHSEGDSVAEITSPVVDRVSGSRPITAPQNDGDSHDKILAALNTHSVDLVVLPCPFGREFESIGTDSAGTVIDVMLSRCPRPMLVVRRDDQTLRQCVSWVSVIVGGECDVESKAASWAFGLSSNSAVITLNLVVEKEQYENIRSIVEALSPEKKLDPQAFTEAMTRTHLSLHGAMAKTAKDLGRTYHLRPQAGEVAPPNPLKNTEKLLLVLPLEVDDRFGQGFVQDRIRRSPHPVLVIPSHVQTETT
ncbi:MAG: universal stress protein [Planctomycetota bacterium]